MLTVEIVLNYPSIRFARCVMDALRPDNRLSKGKGQMRISTHVRGRTLHITISRCARVESMQSTLQDMFRCVKAAEESMASAKPLQKPRGRSGNKRFK